MKLVAVSRSQITFDYELVWGTIGLLVLLAARFFPFHIFPLMPCPFLAMTGLPCPTCGMTRAFIAMSRFDFPTAWKMNPLGTALFAATVGYVIYAAIVVIGRLPRIRIQFAGPWQIRLLFAATLSIVAANWVLLLFRFP